jgi:hypothetical protein
LRWLHAGGPLRDWKKTLPCPPGGRRMDPRIRDHMNTFDKIQIIAQGFLKIAILWWPLTVFVVATVIVGIIKESKASK